MSITASICPSFSKYLKKKSKDERERKRNAEPKIQSIYLFTFKCAWLRQSNAHTHK